MAVIVVVQRTNELAHSQVCSRSAKPFTGNCGRRFAAHNSASIMELSSLTLERSSAARAAISGLLCVAIVWGTVLPR
jgi:hypothetical protein